jgi:PAS domain S-box-containing protein
LPAGVAAFVVAYQLARLALDPQRSPQVFWIDSVIFGVLGPAALWVLLRQMARQAAAGRAAADQLAALAAQEKFLATVVNASADAVVGLDPGGRIRTWNLGAEQLTGLAQAEVVGQLPADVLAPDAAAAVAWAGALGGPSSGEPVQGVEIAVRAQGGAAIPVELAYTPVRNGAERLLGGAAILRDLRPRISAEAEAARLREEAGRAEALGAMIQEMHHRIKNNLQTVADLLSLEMSAGGNAAARKSLSDSVGRIKSIAAVHEMLSAEQMRLTDITELARTVCAISLQHLTRPDSQLETVVTGAPIYLPSKQATALALVLNELVSNALEHAFTAESGRGALSIELASDGPRVTVTVEDNGRGLPAGFDLAGGRGLGLKIVRTLVEKDLAGTLQIGLRADGGTRATLVFYK